MVQHKFIKPTAVCERYGFDKHVLRRTECASRSVRKQGIEPLQFYKKLSARFMNRAGKKSYDDMRGNWKGRRDKLLNIPINRLGLKLTGFPLAGCIEKLNDELTAAGIRFRPPCYLSDGWGCPDLIPIIGIPFYLAHPDLQRIHREMGYDVEDRRTILRTLRHEAGHAINYAYRLYKSKKWVRLFGPINKAYSDHYIPNPFSKHHVIHVKHYYAQKHPDEDFAEVFAVWLTPGNRWKKIYKGTPVMRKLLYVQEIIRKLGSKTPPVTIGEQDVPVEEMSFTLLEYYGITPEQHRRETAAYIKEVLREIFPAELPPGKSIPASAFMLMHGEQLVERIAFWAGLDRAKVKIIFNNFARMADKLKLMAPTDKHATILIDIASLITFYVHTYIHTKKVFRY